MLKKSILLSTSVAMALSAVAPAYAQDDEIIVTATKRQTTLQETPVAVTVTSADTIDKAEIFDIKDLQSVVPSLRVTQLQTAANTNFIVRGFGNGANNAGIEPSVGVFIDGVYRSRSGAQIGDLPVLERVEVLKGPQSTLFGKNASAGVISIVTAKPSFDGNGFIEVGTGNYGLYQAKGYFTGPLSDELAVSLGGGIYKRDGYGEPALAGLENSNDRDRANVRFQALYEPADNWSLRLIADYSTIDENCCIVSNVQTSGAGLAVQALGGQYAPVSDPYSYEYFTNKPSNNSVDDVGISFHADVDLDFATVTSITAFRDNQSNYNQDADYNTLALLDDVNEDREISTFTQELRLTSNTDGPLQWMIGGFYFSEDITQVSGLAYGADLRPYIDFLAGGPAVLGAIEATTLNAPGTFFNDNVETTETFTQDNEAYSIFGTVDFEVSDRLTLTVGGNYTEDRKTVAGSTVNNDVFSNVDLFSGGGAAGVNLLAQGAIASSIATGGTDATGQAFQATFMIPLTAANFAAIGPAGQAAFTAGVGAGVAGGLVPLQFQPQFLPFPNSVESGQTNDDDFTYIIRAAYEVNDDINVYGSYATGFKSSSWNMSRDSRPFFADAAALGSANLLPNNYRAGATADASLNFGTRFAGPEDAEVFELGLKTRFDNGSLNVAVFQQTIDGFQANLFLGTGFRLLNAGEQKTRGAEAELNYRIGNLSMTAAGTYLDAKYDVFTAAQGAAEYIPNADGTYTLTSTDFSGKRVAGVPEVALSLGAIYNHDFTDGVSGYVRGDFQYESDVQITDGFSNANFPGVELSREVKTVNVSAGVDLDSGVSLSFWARNLFDDEYLLSNFPGVAQSGVINAYPSQPRTYGVNLRYNFD